MSYLDSIENHKLPQHIAIIMDGNGRWAKMHGKNRVFGHRNGVKAVRQVSEACAELGVKYLTLYAFSTENWNRPKLEVSALMELLIRTIGSEASTLMKNKIRLKTIGDLSKLPPRVENEIFKLIEKTKENDRMDLILALNYSGKAEMLRAVKNIALEVKKGQISPESITESNINHHLYTSGIPDPELIIRTSGEHRLSNFLLWQCAYSELYFTKKLWPDFDKEALYEAIVSYQKRERRFGKTSDQINLKEAQK
jgi:undecaprenyl diphosphate synthase